MTLFLSDRFGHYARFSRIRHSAVTVAGHDLIQRHFHAFFAVLAAQRSFDLKYLVRLVN
jgi:hypothetical protein